MKRRRFLLAAAAGALSTTLPIRLAQAASRQALTAGTRTLEVNGKPATVFGLTGPDGRPGLIIDQEAGFHVALTNGLKEETLIHWHGLAPPFAQDGVPGLPAPMLTPGETRNYDFALAAPGTHWMHAHTLQEQVLLAAPLIIRSREDRARDEQEVVMLLHDFSFRSPEELLEGLTGQHQKHGKMDHSKMDHGQMPMNGTRPDNMDAMDMGQMDMGAMSMSEQMAMPMDLNDIEYDAYLANDRTLDDPDVIRVDRGGSVRLRVINASASTGFTLDFGMLDASVIAVDGQPVEPLKTGKVPLTMAQRVDLRISIPATGGSFPILALREGTRHRTGIILATAGAEITRLHGEGVESGPVLDLSLEARLRALAPLPQIRPQKSTDINLIGNMKTYRWGLEGAEGLAVSSGDRLEITMTNQTMMAHPMHLHGHHFQVVALDGNRFPGAVRDTVLIPPMRSVTIALDAGNPGTWAFHCHHLYHMVSGMMAFLSYRDA